MPLPLIKPHPNKPQATQSKKFTFSDKNRNRVEIHFKFILI